MTKAMALGVDPTNAEQARAWDGEEGAYWAAHAERFDRAVAAYQHDFLTAAAIHRGDRVLDIGCGTGQTTREVARVAVGGSALGVDLSAEMIAVARRRADDQGIRNAAFHQGDAQVYPFPAALFDAAISRTGTMFFGDPIAAFTNVARALRPGGQLTMLVWQDVEHNEWIQQLSSALAAGRDLPSPPVGAPGPFALARPERIRTVLAAAGFSTIELEPMQAPMWFGADADDAYRFLIGLMGWMLDGLDSAGRASALDALRTTLRAHETGQGVTFGSGMWLVRAHRP
jgi:SAM-dependent methyltransferase